MAAQENPCLICKIDQNCCKVMGLKLSRKEYEQHFRKHSARLSFIKYNKMFIALPKRQLPCPYWRESGCSIYQHRPIDCRLFPYELNRMVEQESHIAVKIYDQTDCPHKENLFIPLDEAKNLIHALARDVYGAGKPVKIDYVPGRKAPRPFGVLNPVIARLSKIIRTCRS